MNYSYYYYTPLRKHAPNEIWGFCADAHGLTMKYVLVVGGVVVGIFLVLVDFLHLLTVYTNGYIYTTSPLPAHTPNHRNTRFFADAHGLTRKCCWWVVLYAPTNPRATHTHPPAHSHLATTRVFFAETHRLTVTAILEHNSGTQKKWKRTANAVANKEMLLGDVRIHEQPTHPPTHTHPATLQGFLADTLRLTVKSMPRLMTEHRTNEGTTAQ